MAVRLSVLRTGSALLPRHIICLLLVIISVRDGVYYIHIYPLSEKLALTSPTSGGRSVGIVRSPTKAKEFNYLYIYIYIYIWLSWRKQELSTCSVCLQVCMTKLQMFYVWAFCHTTNITPIIQFVPNTPDHVLVNAHNSCSDALL
jgi:hypothetical protein